MDAFTAVKVLVVEDEPTLAENMGTYLSGLGGEVCLAESGSRALIVYGVFMPDVVVLDYLLPDMHGFEVLDGLRRGGYGGGCVLVTAHPRHEVLQEARRLGIVHILLKPFALSELAALVLGRTAGRR